ncbi:MAG TPA: two-component regulator propeller domain-containing protein [Promineifilum sp.]
MAELINPYIAGNPVTGEEMFFGRQDVFNFIRQSLIGQHRDQVIVLYGQRRTGKTSILYQMHRNIDPRYLCIFVDLHGLSMESEATFLWELASQIRRVLRRDFGIELPQLDRNVVQADPRDYFSNEFLDQALLTLGDRHILLMMDEAVRLQEQIQLGRLDKSIFEYLRHLMQHYERLNFLFSIGSGLEQMEKEYAFLFNVALYKKISFLERQAAVELVTEPVKEHYQVEPAAIERILEVTACHPYYTQLLCHSLFNRWAKVNGKTIGVADVDAVLEEVVERGLAVLKHTWEDSSPGEKAMLAGLADAMGKRNHAITVRKATEAWEKLDVSVPADEVARAIRSLTARDIITGDDQVRFAVDLQHYWVRKFQRLEWVREEIRDGIKAWGAEATPAKEVKPAADQTAQPMEQVPAASSRWIAIAAVGLVAAVLLILAAALDWGPFDRGSTTPQENAGSVVPGGPAAQVNGLAAAGGAVWAATEGGLVRWSADGQATVISGSDIGFPDDWNQTITTAPDGTIWIGGGRVSHVEPAEDGVTFLDYYDRDSDLGLTRVYALMADADNTIWAGGPWDRESPLSWFDGQDWHHDALPPPEGFSQGELTVTALLRSADGSLWVGTDERGIARWDGEKWSLWGPEDGVGGPDLDDARIRALAQDDSGTIWAAASDRGLVRYDPVSDAWQAVGLPELTGPVTMIAQFEGGVMKAAGDDWLASNPDGGDFWYKIATTEDGIGNEITGIVQDNEGRYWIGAYEGGVSMLEDGIWHHFQQ